MTLQEAQNLKPGKKLTWRGKGESKKSTAHQIWAEDHGETVEFVDFTETKDMGGFPVIIVKGKTGEQRFSSQWFV